MRHSPTRSRHRGAYSLDPRLALLAAVGLVACAGSVMVVLADAPAHQRVLSAVVHGIVVAVPVSVGLAALTRRPYDRFATLLVGIGLLWSTTALAESGHPVLYSIGRVASWIAEAGLIYLLLTFPSGRLTSSAERRTAAAIFGVLLLLYLPTALVVQDYPAPSPWSTCVAQCPDNAFALTASHAASVDDVIRPLREILTVLILLAVALILARRTRDAGPLQRRALAPLVATAAFRLAAMLAYLVGRRSGSVPGALEVIGWLYVLSLPVVALSFAVGRIARGLYAGTALQRLATALRPQAGGPHFRAALANALEDPTLRMLYRVPGDGGPWVDETGRRVRAPEPGRGRQVTEIRSDGRRVGAIVHDPALAHDPALLRAASAYALVVLENSRLIAELQTALRERSRSHARLIAVADETRRRIERDLHDGAQQRLVALRMKLSMQSERLRELAPDAAADVAGLSRDVDETIAEVRDLAHGIYPALLTDRGIGEALRAAARASPIPTSVDTQAVGRYSAEIESTVYFTCVEALQNVAKHADGATRVTISLVADDRLRFDVRDDGCGFDPMPDGNGLTQLRDRVAAVGGSLTVGSRPGEGTHLEGSVPLSVSSGARRPRRGTAAPPSRAC